MTCKDCLHCGICDYDILFTESGIQIKDSEKVEEDCNNFKDKSRFIELPCKVGDTIYFDTFRRGDSIGVQPHKVAKGEVFVSTETQFGSLGAVIPDWQFGKTVFLTREEAEKALANE